MTDLITLVEYKSFKGIEGTKDDPRLNLLIASVSQLVKTYCATSFVDYYTSDKTEYFSLDYQTPVIQLTEGPVVSITSVKERTSYATDYATLTTTANEYYLDTDTDSLIRTTSGGTANWAQGPGAVEAIYKGGYAAIPADLKLAVFDLVQYYHKEEYKERRTIGTASISNQTTSSQWRNVSFPDHIKRILDLYKQTHI